MTISPRLGCSTISFRHLPLPQALTVIGEIGFTEIDLGALPGVCDHVPYVLDRPAVDAVTSEVAASGLAVRSVNGDVGDLNATLTDGQRDDRAEHLTRLLELTEKVGAKALVLPNGALNHAPITDLDSDLTRVADELTNAADRAADHGLEVWVESLHLFRLCHDLDRAQQLTDKLADTEVGVVMDFSHVVASGADPRAFVDRFADRIRHVHLRDATPGDIHHSIGNGVVDFADGLAALRDAGYTGHYILELETRDLPSNDHRPAATAKAAAFISPLI